MRLSDNLGSTKNTLPKFQTKNCRLKMNGFKFEAPRSVTQIEVAPKKCINYSKSANLKYEWTVSNFDTTFNSLESPIFSNDGKNMEYRLKIEKRHPGYSTARPAPLFSLGQPQSLVSNPDRAEESKYAVKIMLVSSDARKIQSHCKFQLLGVTPQKTCSWYHRLQNTLGIYIDCMELNRQSITASYIQDNSITITCEINAVIEISMPYEIPKCTLLDDCEVIFENREFTDFTFCVSDKEFQVHKVILAARSPVFKAMFQHDLEESEINRVDVPGVDKEVFTELLRFVYTGKVRNLNEIAVDLLHVADLYGLENLKMLCVQALSLNISVENAVKVLMLGNLYGTDLLKAIAIGYIAKHAVRVSKTDGWNDMIRSHPELFTEILTHASVQLLQVEVS